MIAHFILSGGELIYAYYLAIVSAKKKLNVDKVILWTTIMPKDSLYWTLAREIVEIKYISKVILPHCERYNEGEQAALNADQLRLGILYKYGGIYLDLDTLTLKDFSYLLDDYEAVISRYYPMHKEYFTNGFLLSVPKSRFIDIATERCMLVLNDGVWKHGWGSSGPNAIDYAYNHYDKNLIRVCERDIFIPFGWWEVRGLDEVQVMLPENLHVLHYYFSVTQDKVRGMNPKWIKQSNSAYANLVKGVLVEREWDI